jgi:hypothetical protein
LALNWFDAKAYLPKMLGMPSFWFGNFGAQPIRPYGPKWDPSSILESQKCILRPAMRFNFFFEYALLHWCIYAGQNIHTRKEPAISLPSLHCVKNMGSWNNCLWFLHMIIL